MDEWRALWSRMTNRALERASSSSRIDHRSLAAQCEEAIALAKTALETGNRKQETGNRKQETGNRKQETGRQEDRKTGRQEDRKTGRQDIAKEQLNRPSNLTALQSHELTVSHAIPKAPKPYAPQNKCRQYRPNKLLTISGRGLKLI
ncbi:MobA/MobL family protein [Pantoea dispersa]|uniref:MobA/MobL family protein n=1 Tax=Pantoea dispersa TaxID=59814 RepID=UPI003D155262